MSNQPLDPDIDEPDPCFDDLDDDWEDDEDWDDDRTLHDNEDEWDEDDWDEDEDDWDDDLSYPNDFDPMNQGY